MFNYINIKPPPGKRIPTIREYANLINPPEVKDDRCLINPYGCITSSSDDDVFVTQVDNKHFSLLPGPEFSPRLYRGQNKFYENCVPSLFRTPMTRITYLVSLLKKFEFYKFMAKHPLVNYLSNWYIDGKKFKIDLEGLSQHYGFSTAMIDLTRSKNVAMFFAVSEKNNAGGHYYPILDESREAVLYEIDLKGILSNNPKDFNVVGFQALPRPYAQKAYSVFIGSRNNFNALPCVCCKRFRINRAESIKYFEMFEGGAKLFPNDIVDDIALEIINSNEIDREVLKTCFESQLIPETLSSITRVIDFLDQFNYIVTEKNIKIPEETEKRMIESLGSEPPLTPGVVKCRFVSEAFSSVEV